MKGVESRGTVELCKQKCCTTSVWVVIFYPWDGVVC